ncbi:MAG: sulfur carrier protein ThiS [Selenomonadaceae bacterium]|nr:sulfur carrier protein ThiS [Selenomonadaceae bacterium]
MLKINGQETDAAGKSISEYLLSANYEPRQIVVEINEEIIAKERYGETLLKDGDVVEIISFMGGG